MMCEVIVNMLGNSKCKGWFNCMQHIFLIKYNILRIELQSFSINLCHNIYYVPLKNYIRCFDNFESNLNHSRLKTVVEGR